VASFPALLTNSINLDNNIPKNNISLPIIIPHPGIITDYWAKALDNDKMSRKEDKMSHRHRKFLTRRKILRKTGLLAGGTALKIQTLPSVATTRKSGNLQIVSVRHQFQEHRFRTPLKFGNTPINNLTVLNVTVGLKNPSGSSALGFGSMPLGNIWSFPPKHAPPDKSLNAMKLLAAEVADLVGNCDRETDPIELAVRLQPQCLQRADRLSRKMKLKTNIPKLCTLVVISPFDAAIHDACGKINGINSYNALGPDYIARDLSHYLDKPFKGKYLDRYTLRRPIPTMPLYHLIGALDPLTEADIGRRIDDRLPETLSQWIKRDGLTHMKIKMNGDDLDWDIERMLSIDRVAEQTQNRLGVKKWAYSADFNERCRNVEYLLEFFGKVREKNPAAFNRLQYVEQPTDRDLNAHPENKMHRAAKIKPVVIDESLTDYQSLILARQQGYSGIALKTCKGQTEALLMAAAALELKMFITVQDLTCPGAAFLHSAGLAARIPTVTAVEGNARQYCPSANREWAKKYPQMFSIKNGTVKTGLLTKPGLGH
jgi:L-alanine-DL-glutamate epimerase-like enolase superfamily enzyme